MLRRIIGLSAGVTLVAACTSSPATTTPCSPETDQALCTRLARNCALLTASDICGVNRTVNCGTCAPPDACGGAGTPNVCGRPADGGSPIGDAGSPDACTWTCPTASHFVTLTAKFDYAGMASGYIKGQWLPLMGETPTVMVSFDEGAVFKDPPASNQYTTRALVSNASVQVKNDPSGIIASQFKGTWSGTITMKYGTSVSFVLDLVTSSLSLQNTMSLSCQIASVKVGSDQYPTLDPFSCTAGYYSLHQSDGTHTTEVAYTLDPGSGPLAYQ